MGLFNAIMGNASEVNINDIRKEFAEILADNEQIESAFKIIRDKWVFTNKRLIMVDVQGVTGTKKEYHSLPYSSIRHFAVETAGTLDLDCEMKIWVAGMTTPYTAYSGRYPFTDSGDTRSLC